MKTRISGPKTRYALGGLSMAILLFWSCQLIAAEIRFSSGPEQVALLELYTSQGCSSCPPADKWMSKLKDHPGLWRDYVPVAFHVDYWDYIGWHDPFAKPKFGKRQRQIAQQGGAPAVYTPGMVLSGKDWRGWRDRSAPVKPKGQPGDLVVQVDGQSVNVTFTPLTQPGSRLHANFVWLEFDQTSNVRAGENRGKNLSNDFIASDWQRVDLMQADGTYTISINRATKAKAETKTRKALAVWVDEGLSLVPLQATGGWMP